MSVPPFTCTPSAELKAMVFAAPAPTPPIVLADELVSNKTPTTLRSAAVPARFVPIKLPSTRFPVED